VRRRQSGDRGGGVVVPLERVAPILYEETLAPSAPPGAVVSSFNRSGFERPACDALEWWSERADGWWWRDSAACLFPLAEGTTVGRTSPWGTRDFPLLVVDPPRSSGPNHTLLTVEPPEIAA